MGVRMRSASTGALIARLSFMAALAAGLVPIRGTAFLWIHAGLGAPFAAAVVLLTVSRPSPTTISAASMLALGTYAALISRGSFWLSPLPILHVAAMTISFIIYERAR